MRIRTGWKPKLNWEFFGKVTLAIILLFFARMLTMRIEILRRYSILEPNIGSFLCAGRVAIAYFFSLAAAVILSLSPYLGVASAAADPNVERLKIGLVLSGGGVRGAAHVGVIKVLEELGIPRDYIAGTSMGSVIGGLYASGLSAAEIERQLDRIDWNGVFSDPPARPEHSQRRKQDDQLYLVKGKAGVSNQGVRLPVAAVLGLVKALNAQHFCYPLVGRLFRP